jgi:hypothetical protein
MTTMKKLSPEAGFLSNAFANCTSEIIRARSFLVAKIHTCGLDLHIVPEMHFGIFLLLKPASESNSIEILPLDNLEGIRTHDLLTPHLCHFL